MQVFKVSQKPKIPKKDLTEQTILKRIKKYHLWV